jgi:toxin ParE1/3/4
VSRRFQLTPEAQRQIDEIGAFIAQDSLDSALKVYDAPEESFELLAENPGIGHTREDITARPVKFWSVFSYLVVYDPQTDPLEVIAVIHGARDVQQLL